MSRLLPAIAMIGAGVVALGAAALGLVWYSAPVNSVASVELERQSLIRMIEEDWFLPASEQAQVIAQVNRVCDLHAAGTITYDECEGVFTQLIEAPLFTILSANAFEEDYVQGSGLSNDEQQQTKRALQRVLRGVFAGTISQDEFYAALPSIYSWEDAFSEDELAGMGDEEIDAVLDKYPDPTDDDLRLSLAKLKSLADRESIPDEPFTVDFSDEMTKVVDRALASAAR
jgi:hypothetical protein